MAVLNERPWPWLGSTFNALPLLRSNFCPFRGQNTMVVDGVRRKTMSQSLAHLILSFIILCPQRLHHQGIHQVYLNKSQLLSQLLALGSKPDHPPLRQILWPCVKLDARSVASSQVFRLFPRDIETV